MIDGKRLRELREAHQFSRKELAARIDVVEMQIVRYETGKNDATGNVLARIAAVFGVSTDYLLGLTDNPAPNIDHDFSPEEIAIISARRRGDYREVMKLIATGE
jgi:transcriptional regulator with XRE-family HTH domain